MAIIARFGSREDGMLRSGFAAMTTIALLGGCAAMPGCPPGLERWTMTELFLGLNWRQGMVTEAQFQDFVAREVTPRLPEGFSIVAAEGAWRSAQTGETIREPTRVIRRLHKAEPTQDAALVAIAAAYKSRFEQDAVLRVDAEVCAAF